MYGIICDGNKQFYVTRIGWICFFILLFLTGCVPDNVKTEAEANKNDHENEFIQIVETELGPDYSLSDVEDYICIRVSDYSLFRDYTASSQLVGTIDHNGNTYDAMYDYDKGILYSDVFKDEIIDSLAETLGMDKSKIIYGCIINHDERDFPTLFPVENRNIEDMLASYNKGQYVEFYLVTSENVYGYDFEDYKKLCESKQKEFDIKILSTDDFKNIEHFKKYYYSIADVGIAHPVVDYENESKDIFDVYNLKGYVCIDNGFDDKIGDIEIIRY